MANLSPEVGSDRCNIFYIHALSTLQKFIQAILMSGRPHKKLNLLIEFSNSIFIKFYFKAY